MRGAATADDEAMSAESGFLIIGGVVALLGVLWGGMTAYNKCCGGKPKMADGSPGSNTDQAV